MYFVVRMKERIIPLDEYLRKAIKNMVLGPTDK